MVKFKKKAQSKKGKQQIVVYTTTGELYFPQRLVYQVLDQRQVLQSLESVSCIRKDPEDDRWCIQCEEEALKFNKWSSAYLKQLRKDLPVVIGVIRLPTGDKMEIYLRCFERVLPVLKLIDKHVPRSSAVGIHLDSCYKLLTVDDPRDAPRPEDVFADEQKIYYEDFYRDIDALEAKARVTGGDYSQEINRLYCEGFKELESRAGTHELRDLERKRLEAFYADGPEQYDELMQFGQAIALARYHAGGKLNPVSFIEKLLAKSF